jgi:hypothetical protein
MRMRIALLPLLALGTTAVPCSAQGGGNDVPRELVQALLFPVALRGQPDPDIAVGRLPEEIPASLVPSHARVVGGLGGSAVLTMAQAPAEAIAGWRAQLEREGWRPLRDPSTGPGPDTPGFVLCGPDRVLLGAWAAPLAQGGSELQVRVMRGEPAHSFCTREPRPAVSDDPAPGAPERARRALEDVPVPTLRTPDGAQGLGMGASRSADRYDADGRLCTTRSSAEIAADYVAQLRQTGWSAGDLRTDAGGTTASAELRDARGTLWRALVAVLPIADSQQFYVVRVVRPTPEERHALVPDVVPVPRAAGPPVPAELVRALLAAPGDSSREVRPTLVTGRLPQALAGAPLPPGARVVGGAEYPDEAMGVVFVAGEPPPTRTTIAQLFGRAGWHPLIQKVLVGHGTSDAVEEYCDANGGLVGVHVIPIRDGGSYLTLHRHGDGGSCRPEARATLGASPLPLLHAPEGATLRHGWGGFGGSPFEAETYGQLETSLSPAAVVEHYAGLLRQAGWVIAPPTADGSTATATGEVRDAQGNTWQGVIAVMALSPTERDVTIRMARPLVW